MNKDQQVDQQLKLLQSVWRRAEGYVFLPYINKDKAKLKERREFWKEGPAFSIPDGWDKIRLHLDRHYLDDLYFTPMVFDRPKRHSDHAARGNRLWADLDGVDPEAIKEELKPQMAWETSPGRFAAIWFMGSSRPETTERGGENHRLTLALGADSSGWDTTQLLRVPGSANNKPGYKDGIRGRLLWKARGLQSWDFIDELPEVPETDTIGGDLADEQLLESIDPYEAYAAVRTKLPSVVRQYLRLKVVDGGMDRSSVAWQIERSLADAGCSLLEIIAIIRPTPWNKFEGRADELKRLTLECSKALAMRSKPDRAASALDTTEERKHDLVPFWNNESFLNAPDPEWIFESFIPRGGCGFIAGIPKSMKSWLGLDLAICAAQGISYLGYEIDRPINVLYLQQEDPTTLVRQRLNTIATSKDPKWSLDVPVNAVRPYPGALYVEVMSGFAANDEGWQTWLAEMVRKHNISLVVMDTLATVAPGTDVDSGFLIKGDVLDPIKEIARDLNCTMCFVHHNTKGQGNARAGQNMVGSGQIHAWADFGLYCKEKTDDNKLTFDHETKYTGTRELKFHMVGLDQDPQQWMPEEFISTPGARAMSQDEDLGERVAKAKVPASLRVRRYLRQHPDASNQEVAKELGVGLRTVTRHRVTKG